MYSFLLVFELVVNVGASIYAPDPAGLRSGEIIPISDPSGIVLVPNGYVTVGNLQWNLVTHLNLTSTCGDVTEIHSPVKKLIAKIPDKTDSFEAIALNTAILTEGIVRKSLSLCRGFEKLAEKKTRTPREAWISAGGSALKKIFGVATDEDVAILTDSMEALKTSVLTTSHVEAKLLTIANASWTREEVLTSSVSGIAQDLLETQTLVQKTRKSLILALNSVNKTINNILLLEDAHHLFASAISLYFEVSEMEEILRISADNRLTQRLIPVDRLDRILQNIETKLPKNLKFHINRIDSLFTLYTEPLLSTFTNGKEFLFSYAIPLWSKSSSYYIYDVLSYPVPIENSTLYGQITELPDHFLLSHSGEKFTELNEKDLSQCTKGVLRKCDINNEIRSTDGSTCISSVALSTKNYQTLCSKKIMKKPRSFARRLINSDSWFIYSMNETEPTLECDNQRKTFTHEIKKMAFFVKIPTKCTMRFDNMYLPKHYVGRTIIPSAWLHEKKQKTKPKTRVPIFSNAELRELLHTKRNESVERKQGLLRGEEGETRDGNKNTIIENLVPDLGLNFAVLKALIHQTDRAVLSDPALLKYHFMKQETWLSIFISVALGFTISMFVSFCVKPTVRKIQNYSRNVRFERENRVQRELRQFIATVQPLIAGHEERIERRMIQNEV